MCLSLPSWSVSPSPIPGSPGAAPLRGDMGEVAVSPRCLAKGREVCCLELTGCMAWPRTSPLAESSPVFSPLAMRDKQVHFLPPLFPVSPSVSREENPAWLISLAAQVIACMGLGERGGIFASSRTLHIQTHRKGKLAASAEKLLKNCS